MNEALPAPVTKQLRVALPPAQAFALFTTDLSRWWPLATHSCSGATAERASFAARAGEWVVEHSRDGKEHRWGQLLVWDPPQRFVMSWHPGAAVAQATRLEVRFQALPDGGTEILLVHGGWGARSDAAAARDSYDGGWTVVLARFAEFARKQEKP